jgi:hypothetical protein
MTSSDNKRQTTLPPSPAKHQTFFCSVFLRNNIPFQETSSGTFLDIFSLNIFEKLKMLTKNFFKEFFCGNTLFLENYQIKVVFVLINSFLPSTLPLLHLSIILNGFPKIRTPCDKRRERLLPQLLLFLFTFHRAPSLSLAPSLEWIR